MREQYQRPVADNAYLEVEMMLEEVQTQRELEPIRMRTIVLAQIERLADERRQLLRTLDRFDDSRVARRRLNEIEEELNSLWQVRRRELR
jgi:flagellar biosynthesis/type III secretory pathway chaperone